MPNVGTTTFLFLRGEPLAKVQRLQDVSRAGVNDHAFRRIGKRGQPYALAGILAGSSGGDVRNKLRELEDQCGTQVGLEDDLGTAFTNQLLLQIEAQPAFRVAGVVGAAGVAFLMNVRVILQDV